MKGAAATRPLFLLAKPLFARLARAIDNPPGAFAPVRPGVIRGFDDAFVGFAPLARRFVLVLIVSHIDSPIVVRFHLVSQWPI